MNVTSHLAVRIKHVIGVILSHRGVRMTWRLMTSYPMRRIAVNFMWPMSINPSNFLQIRLTATNWAIECWPKRIQFCNWRWIFTACIPWPSNSCYLSILVSSQQMMQLNMSWLGNGLNQQPKLYPYSLLNLMTLSVHSQIAFACYLYTDLREAIRYADGNQVLR